jgi:hypothetical protein
MATCACNLTRAFRNDIYNGMPTSDNRPVLPVSLKKPTKDLSTLNTMFVFGELVDRMIRMCPSISQQVKRVSLSGQEK